MWSERPQPPKRNQLAGLAGSISFNVLDNAPLGNRNIVPPPPVLHILLGALASMVSYLPSEGSDCTQKASTVTLVSTPRGDAGGEQHLAAVKSAHQTTLESGHFRKPSRIAASPSG